MQRPASPSNRLTSLVTLLLAALTGCGGGYEYIAPISVAFVPPDVDNVEFVSYRTLTRADFRAEEPSIAYMSKKSKIAAQTTMYISSAVIIDAIEVPSNPDSVRWESIVEGLEFKAVMVPEASWWNPKKTKEKDVRRILEHEQIHFAITELEARRVNDQRDEILARIRARGSSQWDSMSKTQARLKKESDRINMGWNAMQAKFDLETKNGTDEEAQKRWMERIDRLLADADPTGL